MRELKTLLVDDSPVFLGAARRMLVDCPGVRVIAEVMSGEDAVAVSRAMSPDLVLMDLRMPGIGGIEATKVLRKESEPLVAIVTHEVGEEYRRAASDAGACEFIEKRDLYDGVERLVRRILEADTLAVAEVQ